MADPFMGEVRMVGFNFAPKGWAFCDGQFLPISQNTALFSLLGTSFGGDGRSTFALPDFRGRVPVHAGQGNGLSNRTLGEIGGTEVASIPILPVSSPATESSQQTAVIDAQGAGTVESGTPAPPYQIDNMQPFLTANFIIALQGVYPVRD